MGDATSSVNTNVTSTTTDTSGIIGFLDGVFSHIDQAIARTKTWNDETHHHHHGASQQTSGGGGDQWVTGGTNWDAYDLPTLVSMVAAPASPSQVQSVAGLWRTNGTAITQSADSLSQSLTTLMNFWQGTASQTVSDSVANTSSWITTVGDTAGKVADQIEDAGGALQSAQNTMPGQPTNPYWAAYNTAADGATTGTAGGPFGVAAGTMVGGMASVFTANSDSSAEKQQAVQTMQRFEQAGMSIDTGTPTFTTPPTWGTGTTTGTGGVAPAVTVGAPGTQPQSTPNLTTTPSFADNPNGRWNALTGGAFGKGGAISGAGGLGKVGAGGGAMGLFGGGALSAVDDAERHGTTPGAVSGASTAAVARGEDAAGVPGRNTGASGSGTDGAEVTSVMEEADAGGPAAARGAAGGGMMGTPMMGGMGGMGGRGSDSEHKRRIPFEEDPFITGLKAVPPVIGLAGTEREDTER